MLIAKHTLRANLPEPVLLSARWARDQLIYLGVRVHNIGFKEVPTLEEPIFIIGCPRSGTSLAVRLFATHPWVANWSEAGRVWEPHGFSDPEADHYWDANMVSEKVVKRLHAAFEGYRRFRKKKRFVNKHPRNSVRIDYIRRVFPNAFFIHVIRDGRAVVNSIINEIKREKIRQRIPFGNFCKPPDWRRFLRNDPVEQAAYQWREIVSYVLSLRDELGDSYWEFKYEDMCMKPKEVFYLAFKSVGLPASEGFLSGIPERLRDMNFRYREELSQAQIDTINTAQNELLQDLGYGPSIG